MAAALQGLDSCGGLPNSALNVKFAPLFDGVTVIVPDATSRGRKGRQDSRNLTGVARSIRIARLPVEVTDTKGADVRDVLRDQGPDAVRKGLPKRARGTKASNGIDFALISGRNYCGEITD